MLNNMLGDLRLYLRLIGMQLRAQIQYKVNLLIDIGTYFLITGLEFAAIMLLFGTFPSILGWRIGEVALLYSFTSISFGLAELFGAGIDAFDITIRRGEFDRVLLRPIGAFTQLIGSDFRLRRFGRLTQGLLAFGIALKLLPGLTWTPLKFILLPIGIVSGAIVFTAIMLLGATLCFWTVETTELTNILTYGGREMLSYPLSIYNSGLQRFFLFVIPLAFCSYIPVCYLLDRSLPFGLPGGLAFASPLVALVFALTSGAIWRFGVSHYQSTGS
jgi:ABC-2 type transport system permease protein